VTVRAVGQRAPHVKRNSHRWRSEPRERGAFVPSKGASKARGRPAMRARSHAGRRDPRHRRDGVRASQLRVPLDQVAPLE
jgi:hypothetical protein